MLIELMCAQRSNIVLGDFYKAKMFVIVMPNILWSGNVSVFL